MDASEIHLERALNEYNSIVNMLEPDGTSPELVEAYVNRGCILYMMGYLTSAMEDLCSASDMIEEIESSGTEIDAGTFVKAHATMGAILFEQRSEIAEEYSCALTRLDRLTTGSNHFDRAGIIRMCLESAQNLLESEYPEDAEKFIRKGIDILENSDGKWSGNRRMELYALLGECYLAMGDLRTAINHYTEAITIGAMLSESHEIEDVEEMVVPLIARLQCESDLGLDDLYLMDLRIVIYMLEDMAKNNCLKDPDLLIKMHQDAAAALMNKGQVQEAEQHLMKAMSMGVQGAKSYLMNQTNAQF